MNLYQHYKTNIDIRVTSHTNLDLHIVKYLSLGVDWNDKLTRDARGLVINSMGKIIARPFTKFFNLNELESQEKFDDIRSLSEWEEGPFEVYDKLDGSLVTVFYSEELDDIYFASTGSLEGYHTGVFRDYVKQYWSKETYEKVKTLSSIYTLLFEYTAPDNRVVLEYKEPKMTLLGMISTETGRDLFSSEYENIALKLGVPVAERLNFDTKESLLEYLRKTKGIEGVIVRFKETGKRLKLKTSEYVTLHKAITHLDITDPYSEKNIKTVYDFMFDETKDLGLLDDFISILFNMEHTKPYAEAIVSIKEIILADLEKYKQFEWLFLENIEKFDFENDLFKIDRRTIVANLESTYITLNGFAFSNKFILRFTTKYNSFIKLQHEYLDLIKVVKPLSKKKDLMLSFKDIYGQVSNYNSLISFRSYMYKVYISKDYVLLEDIQAIVKRKRESI